MGIDIIPYKICTLDCVYCQLGPTTTKTIKRENFTSLDDILDELNCVLGQRKKIDYITLSGSGEPTLHSHIGDIIKAIKGMTAIPIAVITNGTLLFQKQVRESLYEADLVIPSIDAVTQDVFMEVNRPHSSLKVDQIIEGIRYFSDEFKSEIWLEIMLIKGFNDHRDELEKMKAIISNINPQKIHLNTVVRPPAESYAQELFNSELQKISTMLGEKYDIIGEFQSEEQENSNRGKRNEIVDLTRRRPVTLLDISSTLGVHKNEAIKYIQDLLKEKIIHSIFHDGQTYYRSS